MGLSPWAAREICLPSSSARATSGAGSPGFKTGICVGLSGLSALNLSLEMIVDHIGAHHGRVADEVEHGVMDRLAGHGLPGESAKVKVQSAKFKIEDKSRRLK